MTEREAKQQGLHFTGMSFSPWDTASKMHYKARVAEIKKQYKVRLVLVTENNGWKGYYGDANYELIARNKEQQLRNIVDNFDKTVESIKKQCEEMIAQELERKQEAEARLLEIEAIKKI